MQLIVADYQIEDFREKTRRNTYRIVDALEARWKKARRVDSE